jgi:hypothetical protein
MGVSSLLYILIARKYGSYVRTRSLTLLTGYFPRSTALGRRSGTPCIPTAGTEALIAAQFTLLDRQSRTGFAAPFIDDALYSEAFRVRLWSM